MSITPNKSVAPADIPHITAQAEMVLTALVRGDCSVPELLALGVPQYNARISELRDHLAADGLTVAITRTQGRVNWFGIRKISEVGDPRRGARPPKPKQPSRDCGGVNASVGNAKYLLADAAVRRVALRDKKRTCSQLWLFKR